MSNDGNDQNNVLIVDRSLVSMKLDWEASLLIGQIYVEHPDRNYRFLNIESTDSRSLFNFPLLTDIT